MVGFLLWYSNLGLPMLKYLYDIKVYKYLLYLSYNTKYKAYVNYIVFCKFKKCNNYTIINVNYHKINVRDVLFIFNIHF